MWYDDPIHGLCWVACFTEGRNIEGLDKIFKNYLTVFVTKIVNLQLN